MEKQVKEEVCPHREKIKEKLKFLLNKSEKSVKIRRSKLKTATKVVVNLIFAVYVGRAYD